MSDVWNVDYSMDDGLRNTRRGLFSTAGSPYNLITEHAFFLNGLGM